MTFGTFESYYKHPFSTAINLREYVFDMANCVDNMNYRFKGDYWNRCAPFHKDVALCSVYNFDLTDQTIALNDCCPCISLSFFGFFQALGDDVKEVNHNFGGYFINSYNDTCIDDMYVADDHGNRCDYYTGNLLNCGLNDTDEFISGE